MLTFVRVTPDGPIDPPRIGPSNLISLAAYCG